MSNFLKEVSGLPRGVAIAASDLSAIYRAGKTSISSGVATQAVTFSTTLGTTNYAITCNLLNTTDANPQFQPITVTAQSATGFTVKFNVPTDTANYVLSWNAVVNN